MCHPVRDAADFKTSQTIRGMDVSLQHRLRRLQGIAIGTKGGGLPNPNYIFSFSRIYSSVFTFLPMRSYFRIH
jgi:hypothetical protein